jgi:hypothetical protein
LSPSQWIALGVAFVAAVWYVLWLRTLLHRSREADRQIDRSKLRPWKDDAGDA